MFSGIEVSLLALESLISAEDITPLEFYSSLSAYRHLLNRLRENFKRRELVGDGTTTQVRVHRLLTELGTKSFYSERSSRLVSQDDDDRRT